MFLATNQQQSKILIHEGLIQMYLILKRKNTRLRNWRNFHRSNTIS
nr:MAG TPA: hypothetical protein [Caudoviricetes sp.]DAS61531.1 MAG TPA: hypothetical protein [Caudoviricetes sp.]